MGRKHNAESMVCRHGMRQQQIREQSHWQGLDSTKFWELHDYISYQHSLLMDPGSRSLFKTFKLEAYLKNIKNTVPTS